MSETSPEPATLTLFATPKRFQGHIDNIQRNAIASWTRLNPRPEIILFGADDGTVPKSGPRCIPFEDRYFYRSFLFDAPEFDQLYSETRSWSDLRVVAPSPRRAPRIATIDE